MNWDQLEGNWRQIKGAIQQRWGRLTENDLTEIAGRREILLGKLQEIYGLARESAERELDRLQQACAEHSSSVACSAESREEH